MFDLTLQKPWKLLEHFLTGRSQKIVINGISPSLRYLLTGVPQGSILGPLLFLIYITDIINDLAMFTCLPMTHPYKNVWIDMMILN